MERASEAGGAREEGKVRGRRGGRVRESKRTTARGTGAREGTARPEVAPYRVRILRGFVRDAHVARRRRNPESRRNPEATVPP